MNVKKILVFALSLLYVLHEMPTIAIRYPSALFAVLIVCLFVILLNAIGIKKFVKILPIFIIPLMDVLFLSGDTVSLFQGISGILQSLMLPMLTLYLYKMKDVKMAIFLFVVFVIINLITCFTTYIGCQIYPGASRDLVTGLLQGTPMYRIYLNANIGGFGFIYQVVLLSVLAICSLKNYRQLVKGYLVLIISLVLLAGICMAVIAAEYSTAIILLSFSLLLLFARRTFNLKRIVFWCASMSFAFFVFKSYVAEGLMTIADDVESSNVSHRLTDIALSLDGKYTQNNSDMDARVDCYKISLTSFTHNPLGGWSQSVSGKHSFIFDSLAKYGLLGLLLLIITFRKLYRYYLLPLKGTFVYGYGIFAYLLFIVMAVINPIIFTDVIMFVIPLYVMSLIKNVRKNNVVQMPHKTYI